MRLLQSIAQRVPDLPEAERRTALLLLQDPQHFVRQPVQALAQAAKVSQPTVLRLCRRLGFRGLAEFKLQLAAEVGQGVPFIHRSVQADDPALALGHKLVADAQLALQAWRHSLHGAVLQSAVELLYRAWANRGRVEIYGLGHSGVVALDAQHKCLRLGVHALASSDVHMQIMNAARLREPDVLVLISSSGRSRELLEALAVAQQHGAASLAITASASPLAQAAQVHLPVDHSEQSERDIPMTSRLLHLVCVDVLTTALALKIGVPALQPMLQEMKAQLRVRRTTGAQPS